MSQLELACAVLVGVLVASACGGREDTTSATVGNGGASGSGVVGATSSAGSGGKGTSSGAGGAGDAGTGSAGGSLAGTGGYDGGVTGGTGGLPVGTGGHDGGVTGGSAGGFGPTGGRAGGSGGSGGSSTTAGGGAPGAGGTMGTGAGGTRGSGGIPGSGGVGGVAGSTSVGGGAGMGGVAGTGGVGPGRGVTYCTPPYADPLIATSVLVSDFDGETGTSIQTVMPGGAWAPDSDLAGVTSMKVEPCGTSGNGLHFKGSGHNIWGADVAATLVSAIQPVDVSRFRGISFVARSSIPASLLFIVHTPYSQPSCGRCMDIGALPGEECFSGYLRIVSTLADVGPHIVWWADLSQQGWGYRPPGTAEFDANNLVDIVFAFDKGVDFDVCIDDVKFIP